MPEYTGYHEGSLEFLKTNNISVGDNVEISSDSKYSGTIMPRYEHGDNKHVVLKLKNGYNIGLEIAKIENVKKIPSLKREISKNEKIEKNEKMQNILLLSTGGTIASKIDYRTGSVTPILTAEELNSSIPELSNIANIDTKALFSEYSENIMPEHWLEIAEKVKQYSESDYTGIIIAHGTDTMHYTSSYLSFALAGFPIPIAFVGSQRSSDRASSDAALNLIGAAKFLTEYKKNGIYVIMHHDENDETIACHLGTRVRKNHTSKRGAFQTIGGEPAFFILNDKITDRSKKYFFTTNKFEPKIKLNEKVALVKYYPGYDPSILKNLIELGYKAIIFEGTGLGHVGKNIYSVIKTAHQKGIFMGMTSQCIDGRVSMTVYESGRDLLNLGVVPLENMIPEVALVKSMWAIGNTDNHEEVKEIMLCEIASEFST